MLITPSLPARRPRKTEPPAPPTPPPAVPAVVVSATLGDDGGVCTVVFDRPVALAGPPPYAIDGAVTFAGRAPLDVAPAPADPSALTFAMDGSVETGKPWAILAQPAWLATPVLVPQGGTLE